MNATISSRPAAAVAATAVSPKAAVIRVMIAEPIGIISMPMEAGTANRMISFHELLSRFHGIRSKPSRPWRL